MDVKCIIIRRKRNAKNSYMQKIHANAKKASVLLPFTVMGYSEGWKNAQCFAVKKDKILRDKDLKWLKIIKKRNLRKLA